MVTSHPFREFGIISFDGVSEFVAPTGRFVYLPVRCLTVFGAIIDVLAPSTAQQGVRLAARLTGTMLMLLLMMIWIANHPHMLPKIRYIVYIYRCRCWCWNEGWNTREGGGGRWEGGGGTEDEAKELVPSVYEIIHRARKRIWNRI